MSTELRIHRRAMVLRTCLALLTLAGLVGQGAPYAQVAVDAPVVQSTTQSPRILLRAARLFDGRHLYDNAAVIVSEGTIAALGSADQVLTPEAIVRDLGDATILPGFIELHGHITLRGVPHETILRHGVTTVRDVGGPLFPPAGGDGRLRLLTAGPIITAPGGYPLPVFGSTDVAAAVESPTQARQLVRQLVAGGAVVVKVGLDPGGEPGAPWTTAHAPHPIPPWPLLSLDTVAAIVEEAHRLGRRVTAHVGETQGVSLALAAGVDEWAHMPCTAIAEPLLKQAVQQDVKIVTTLDTLSQCPGIHQNTATLAALGATLLYGAEIGHPEIPWGIDAAELHRILHVTGMTPLELFRTATAKAGEHLGLAPLGMLTPGAPADLIAVRGNPFTNFKLLEYPDLVMSGGRIVADHFDR